jgi:hypothetical protein
MGVFKWMASVGSGFILSPQTTRERSRKYQREANELLEEQLHAIQDLAQPQTPSDTRPRRPCPWCLEMMLRGASTCPHCHTTGITWSTETTREPVDSQTEETVNTGKERADSLAKERAQSRKIKAGAVCYKCGGNVSIFSNGTVHCMKCKQKLRRNKLQER